MENTYPICKPHDLIKYYRDEIDLEITMDQFTNPTVCCFLDDVSIKLIAEPTIFLVFSNNLEIMLGHPK